MIHRMFIKPEDKDKAIEIIADTLEEYIGDFDKYLKENGDHNRSDNAIDTNEFYLKGNKIAVITDIGCKELLALAVDGRRKSKITIFWDAEYFIASDLIYDVTY